MHKNHNIVNSLHVKPDSFNNNFLSVAEKITREIIGKNERNNYENSNPMFYIRQSFKNPFSQIKFHYSSTTEIERIINSLKSKDSSGYDEISTKIFKLSAPYISSPLNHIFNKSLTLGIFPSHLKYSIIKPIFKKGDGNNMTNYRPISLLISFSKGLRKNFLQ
jgi:hypothetical protein